MLLALNIISHLLSRVAYEPLTPQDVELPTRQTTGGCLEPNLPLRPHPPHRSDTVAPNVCAADVVLTEHAGVARRRGWS